MNIPSLPSIKKIRTSILNKETTVTEIIQEHLDRIEKTEKDLNAFVTVLKDEALKEASRIDTLITSGDESVNNLKLLGIPFTVKDLYLVKNTKTTFGSRLMEEFIAPYTSTVVQKCLDEGAILLGKTNCDPWGNGSTGENSGYGPTKNPYDLNKPAGGSSSGSAASLAAGVGFFSLGTDTGGSVRLPASINGLYGMKPTYGRNSRFGIGVMGSSFDTPGFFARHSEDIAYLEEIMQGNDINDATTSTQSLNIQIKDSNLRIGKPKEFFGSAIDEEILHEIDSYLEKLQKEGHTIVDVSIPSLSYGLAAYYILVPSEISANRARYDGVRYGVKVSDDYQENLYGSRSEYFEDEVQRRIMIGTYCLSAGFGDQLYQKASIVRTKLKDEFKNIFEEVDVIAAPVVPSKMPNLGENIDDPLANYLLDIYNVTANLAGVPSLAVPISKPRNGLPIGMQFMGKWGEDMVLTQL